MFVDFASLPIFSKQPTENPLSPHPQNLCGHPGLCGTLPFSWTGVSTLSLCSEKVTSACAGMDDCGLHDDPAILDEFLDMSAGVGVSDFRLFCGVEPYLALADTSDSSGKALLRAKVDHDLESLLETKYLHGKMITLSDEVRLLDEVQLRTVDDWVLRNQATENLIR